MNNNLKMTKGMEKYLENWRKTYYEAAGRDRLRWFMDEITGEVHDGWDQLTCMINAVTHLVILKFLGIADVKAEEKRCKRFLDNQRYGCCGEEVGGGIYDQDRRAAKFPVQRRPHRRDRSRGSPELGILRAGLRDATRGAGQPGLSPQGGEADPVRPLF